MNKIACTTAATLALILSGSALAQRAGSWSASLNITKLSPVVTSGNLTAPSLPNTTATILADTQPTGAVNFMVTNNVAISIPLGLGFSHDVIATGAIAGSGKLATTKVLPITLLAQYRFMGTDAKFRPYVGAGLTYAKFYDTNGTGVLTALTNPGGAATTIGFESKLAPTVQVGMIFDLDKKWYIDVGYTKTFLSTRGTLSTGQTMDTRLDPDSYTIGIGYKF